MKKNIVIFMFFSILFLGCGKKDNTENIIAMVDNYEITKDDFNNEKQKCNLIYSSSNDNNKIINILIDQTVLLKEAEDRKIHLQKKFLQSMEDYFRQSLINELLTVKNAEIKSKININQEDIDKFYNLLGFEYNIRQVNLKSSIKPSNNILTVDEFNAFINQNSKEIDQDSNYIWVDLRDIKPEIRSFLINAKIDKLQNNSVILINDPEIQTIVHMIDKKTNQIPPLNVILNDLKQQLQSEQERLAIKNWMTELKKKAKISTCEISKL